MHFISRKTNGYKIYAVSGVNSVSFAIDFDDADTKGLLGFAVERHDRTENERYFMRGFKVFKEIIPSPDEHTIVSTLDHPIQSFVWDDFTNKPEHDYKYFFYPLKGEPHNIDRSEKPIAITVKTEPLYDNSNKHDVFFNRGVASSQAFVRKFHGAIPDKSVDPLKSRAMLNWLTRDLESALLEFITQAKKGDTLLACVYEFHYQPIVDAFKEAIDRGVHVQIIIDAKNNTQKFPRGANRKAIKAAGIPQKHVILREANQNHIQHNKFIVHLKGKTKKPTAVWTGSTNISEGGIFGQTNVGHWVRDQQTAQLFTQYWQLLSQDLGGKANQSRTQQAKENNAFKQSVVALQQDIEVSTIAKMPASITPIFSPRTSDAMLHTYASLLDSANEYAAITLAFGISDIFKQILSDNTAKSHITFMLLEKKDVLRAGSTKKFTKLTTTNNVYEAWGSYIKDPLYQWTKEVNTKMLKLNQHVMYIHSKFLLVDPLGNKPIVVTGSANFSEASTVDNDENMLIITGNKRVADIYFTEFNRLFNHYYFRSIYESQKHRDTSGEEASLFLAPNDSWLGKYKKGKLRYKRVKIFQKLSL